MKKLTALLLALTLTVALATSALAAAPQLISANPNAGYEYTITVNGTALDTSKLPAVSAVYVPLRAVTEADHGFADWYQDENKSFFSLDSNRIYVDCKTGAVELNGENIAEIKAVFVGGVTFIPMGLLNRLQGYTAVVKEQQITVTTPNGAPLAKLGYSIVDAVKLSSTSRNAADTLESFFGLQAGNYTETASFLPMMNIKADGLFIGKVADGKMDAAKQELEAYRAKIQQNFEQYLPDQLELAKNGQVVASGSYVMLIISADNDTAIQMFQNGVKDLK